MSNESDMVIAVERRGDAAILRIRGDLGPQRPERLTQQAADLLDAPVRLIVADLSGVPFVTSHGLRELVTCGAQANLRQSRFVLAGVPPFMRQVLETTQLTRFFDLYETAEAALAATPAAGTAR